MHRLAVAGLIKSFYVMVKNTHRHPVNRSLHAIGLPLYLFGFGLIVGHLAGYDSDPLQGAALWLAGVSAFVLGHRIEGNLGAITPILACRLVARKLGGYIGTDRIHVQAR